MLTPQDFVTCVVDNLKAKGFQKKRIDEITQDYEDIVNMYRSQGRDVVTASTLGMSDLFERMSRETIEKAKRTSKMISVQAENIALVRSAKDKSTSLFLLDGKPGSKGVAVARAAVAKIEDDPRFATQAYTGIKETVRGQLYALFGGTLDHIGKGAFGRQKGKAHLENIIREVKGEGTGDAAAREFAQAWLKVQDVGVDLFNQAGGSMRKLARYIPQSFNAVNVAKAGRDEWVQFHMNAIDWTETRWPNGLPIEPSQRQGVLENVYSTLASDGATKIDAKAFRGRGKAVGNMLDNHRFLHYKDAQSWIDAHSRFGDGNIFDVFVRHIEDLSHRIALVETFGPNPDMTAMNMASIVRKEAASLGPKEQADAEAVMKNKFMPMFETLTRQNPMDPNSTMGALVVGTANILTSAQLGSAAILAIPGDFVTTAAVRALNHMGLFDGVGFYVKSLATDRKFMGEIAAQSGFVHDEAVMSTYAAARFGVAAQYGPATTRVVADSVMRLSLLSGHTRAARWTVQAEFMGLMERSRSQAFDDLPFKQVLERYGISSAEWDALRNNVGTWSPRKDVKFMRPIDILETAMPDKQLLYRKFQGMIADESRKMVPESTIEGSVYLKDTTRPDTLVGSLLYSFAMYKNFPVSMAMIYGRLGVTANPVMGSKALGRLRFYAGLGAAMTVVGALGVQLREVSKGREPMPMDNLGFLGKAFLSGGAMSIWGDFLFTGVNEYGRGPQEVIAGPLAGFLGDTTELVLGDAFQFAEVVGGLSDKEFKSTTPARAVEWVKRYTPGSSVWWARLALEREVFDRLSEIADPATYKKRRKKVRKQKETFGNDYYLAPGERVIE